MHGCQRTRVRFMLRRIRWRDHAGCCPLHTGVDMRAIDHVVSLAESTGATLVAVSLILTPHKPGSRGPRLEHIQQSKDFLEAVKWKTRRHEVPVERHEVFTADVMQSIVLLVGEMRCAGIILVTSSEREALLQAHEVKRLLINPPASLVIIRLSQYPAQVQRPHTGNPIPVVATEAMGTAEPRLVGAEFAGSRGTAADERGGRHRP